MARGDTGAAGKSALWALRRGFAKSAAQVADLPLAVIGATQDRVGHDALAARAGTDMLPLLLEGPDGRRGALWLDRAAVAALVEHQTTGRIGGKPAPDRAFTPTDAALVAPVLDAALTGAAALSEVAADRLCLAGFRFGAQAEDTATLLLTIEAERLRLFDLTLDFDGGAAQGALLLALPEPLADPPPVPADTAPPPRRTLSGQAHDSLRADLSAVICRMRLPLSTLAGLSPGDLVELKDDRLDETELMTIAGSCVATGQLGQAGGFRALRLAGAPSKGKHAPAAPPGFQVARPPRRKQAPEPAPEDAQLPQVLADVEELQLETMSPDRAAQEISELAGLSLEDDPWTESGTAAGAPARPGADGDDVT